MAAVSDLLNSVSLEMTKASQNTNQSRENETPFTPKSLEKLVDEDTSSNVDEISAIYPR
jgi:hypothetical protein